MYASFFLMFRDQVVNMQDACLAVRQQADDMQASRSHHCRSLHGPPILPSQQRASRCWRDRRPLHPKGARFGEQRTWGMESHPPPSA